jgi:3-deoxy-D-manno-octulosonic-acid transferase
MSLLFGWSLNVVYLLLLSTVAPVLVYRRFTAGKYRRGWSEKLTGCLSRQHPDRPCLWFHAVSVGEVLQLQKVVEDCESRFSNCEFVITVTTETGFDVARTKYPRHTIQYFPLDFTWAVNRALSAIRPNLIVLVELELWPNFILAAKRRQIPLVLINGRIGEKSFRGYQRIRSLMARLLGCFEVLACQTATYVDRLKALGASVDRVTVTGNIKFDRVESNRNNPQTLGLKQAFCLTETDRVFIAGSTQAPEEQYAVDAYKQLLPRFPALRLIIVPRHKERFEEVAQLIRDNQCELLRRSDCQLPTTDRSNATDSGHCPVILLDTLGELAACYGLAEIAFVGGSLTNRGGQNMLEPAGFGAAVLFGPNTWNFKDIAESLLTLNAAKVVTGPDQLYSTVAELLEDPATGQQMGQAAAEWVRTQQGATQRTVDLIENVFHTKSRAPLPRRTDTRRIVKDAA